MALKLIPPGKYGNKFYRARGRLNGQLYNESLETLDKNVAKRRLADVQAKLIAVAQEESKPVAKPKKAIPTYAEATDAYLDFKDFCKAEKNRHFRLCSLIGPMSVAEVTHADLVKAAKKLYPDGKASSLNKSVITPASAVLRYAQANQWRPNHTPLARFEEDEPETKALRPEQVDHLISTAREAAERVKEFVPVFALLVFLFNQGLRVTDAVDLRWKRVSLKDHSYFVRIGKSDKWKVKKLHQDTVQVLRLLEAEEHDLEDRVFPWNDRWQVYDALAPICDMAKIHFTPHMARHTLGFRLGKVSMKTRMDIMDHRSERSSLRYDMSQLAEQEAALDEIGSLLDDKNVTSSVTSAKKGK